MDPGSSQHETKPRQPRRRYPYGVLNFDSSSQTLLTGCPRTISLPEPDDSPGAPPGASFVSGITSRPSVRRIHPLGIAVRPTRALIHGIFVNYRQVGMYICMYSIIYAARVPRPPAQQTAQQTRSRGSEREPCPERWHAGTLHPAKPPVARQHPGPASSVTFITENSKRSISLATQHSM